MSSNNGSSSTGDELAKKLAELEFSSGALTNSSVPESTQRRIATPKPRSRASPTTAQTGLPLSIPPRETSPAPARRSARTSSTGKSGVSGKRTHSGDDLYSSLSASTGRPEIVITDTDAPDPKRSKRIEGEKDDETMRNA